jgi:acyl-CoA synthetase (AMP-forming)/AMP-acid ligase II
MDLGAPVMSPSATAREWGVRPVPDRLADEYVRAGHWTGLRLEDVWTRTVARWPWLPAVEQGTTRLTYGQAAGLVNSVAAFLRSRGVGSGDVVCWQLPNWWESFVLAQAIWQVGGVSCPIVPIYRERELGHVLAETRPAAVVTCSGFRGTDHVDLFETALDVSGVAPAARIVVRGDKTPPGWTAFELVLDTPDRGSSGAAEGSAADPRLLLFTSGTTAAPKGVVHTSRTVLAEGQQIVLGRGIGWEDKSYVAAPMSHAAGMWLGLVVPPLAGASTLLDDVWSADRAGAAIRDNAVTFTVGPTTFLKDLTGAVAGAGQPLTTLRNFACGGAPVSAATIAAADAAGIPVTRGYGMTELPTVTMSNRSLPFPERTSTDGPVAEGVEVEVRHAQGDMGGELFVRGPERMAGYLRREDSDASIDSDGWFSTGDVGFVQNGLVTITGRVKEIINRGGEKFSSREIEEALERHPGVLAAGVVPAPDERLGEVPAAFVVTASRVEAEALEQFLQEEGLAKQKTPVRWEFLDRLPLTASGKVSRVELIARTHDG